MGKTQTAKKIRARRTPRSPVTKLKNDLSGNSASTANKVHPPANSTASSPNPSHTPSTFGAITKAGTFNSVHTMRYGNRMRTDHFAVESKSNPAPPTSMMIPERYARAVRPGTHAATGCQTSAKSP